MEEAFKIDLYSHEHFMREAIREAHKAIDKNEVPIGCVIVSNNKIIAKGHNLTETLVDVTAHAEMQAITSAASFLNSKYLVDCSIYITLEPCLMCAGALRWAQISHIIYGASDQKYGFAKYTDAIKHPKTEIISGVLENECSLLLKNFFAKLRK